jgi:hypothetical protein
MELIERTAAPALRRLARGFPVIVITGPRQSGKTTLARSVFPDLPYLSMEMPQMRAFVEGDPSLFLERYGDGAVIDEAQIFPELFSWLQTHVDLSGRMGRFVLTGSQNLVLSRTVSQSLAGRAGLVQLLPLSCAELRAAGRLPGSLDEAVYLGGYPVVHARDVRVADWFDGYLSSYVQRDVRDLSAVQDLPAFMRFVRLCAARTGQLLNLSSIANDMGLSHSTVRAWLGILEATYVVFLLQPHHRNFGKRLVKTPKLYFHDTGLACHLLGIDDPRQLTLRAERGALFETWVINEFLKRRFNDARSSNAWFWRDNVGTEIDLVLEQEGLLWPAEIKSAATFHPELLRGLHKFTQYAGAESAPPALVHGGRESWMQAGAHLISWRDL